MPRTPLHTREEMVKISLQIVRRQGADALTARNIGKAMGCSSSPIFTLFENMDDLLRSVRKAARAMFVDYVRDVTDYSPAFKEYGLRLIRCAVRERNLFDFIFLSDDGLNRYSDPIVTECLELMAKEQDLSSEQAGLVLEHMWPYACGVAVLSSRNPDMFTEEAVNGMLSFQFAAILTLMRSGKTPVNPIPSVTR